MPILCARLQTLHVFLMAFLSACVLSQDEDDDDDGPAPSAPTATGAAADEAGEDDEDVGDLFGSDDDGAGSDAGFGASQADGVPSGEPLDFALPRQPRPADDAKLFLTKLPNIIKIQPRPFDPETYQEEDDLLTTGGDGLGASLGMAASRNVAANMIRWRETASGGMQSNTKIVKWSDGSMTLHVGNEVLKCMVNSMPEGSTHLLSMHGGSNLECHGILRHKLSLAPVSTKSATHKALSKDIAKNHTKAKRMQLVTTTQNPEEKKRQDELAWEDSKRLREKQAARRQRADGQADGPMLTSQFLDDDDDDGALEGNLGALKRAHKAGKRAGGGGRKRPAGGGYATGGKRRRPGLASARRGSDDSDYDEGSSDEPEDDEEVPGEMDGFLVGSGDEEDSAADEEEAEMTSDDGDESDESDKPKKKKGKGKKDKAKGKKKAKKARLVDEDDSD